LIVLSAYQHLPVALVSSLRETSILFAVLLGVLALKEKFTLDKVILVILLVVGVAILYWA
jgi:drug/metabolite transporter (DMT)-like permease